MVNTHLLGKMGEELVIAYLCTIGYQVISKNFRCKLGEIDLIAREGNDLVFVEIKTRSGYDYGLPQESVNFAKRQKIKKVALYYLQKNNLLDCNCRFDVVAAIVNKHKLEQVEVISNAF